MRKFFLRVWFSIAAFWTWMYIKIRYYQYWSKLYRLIWERKYTMPVSSFVSMNDLVRFLSTLVWTADSWREMFDAISKPEKVEEIGRGEGDHKVGDCDEFAIYIANAMKKSIEAGYMQEFSFPRLLTVTWMLPNGGVSGHNVCLMNHSSGMVVYMDYGHPIHARDVETLVKSITWRYGRDATWAVYAISDPVSLKPEFVVKNSSKNFLVE